MPAAARMLNALSDDMPEFDRQMGCMAGIFQIFDRQRMLTARRGGRQAQKRLPAGRSAKLISDVPVQSSSTPKIILEKTFSKSMTENSSLSIESSRGSCSSSSCSSFSSHDGNKSVQQELPYINEELFVPRPLESSPSLKGAVMDNNSGQPNFGFRDIVKDSINRDSGGLTVKTLPKEARRNVQYKDSPRPLLLSKSMDGTYVIGIDRSTKVPASVTESGRRFQEQSRFSCDDRRLLRPVETQENKKPSTRPRELPRLSLDSRKESLSPSSRLKNFSYRRTDDSLLDTLRPQDSPSHRRANSVITKLMGLEEAPDATGVLIADTYEPARSPRPAQATPSERPSRSPRSACQNTCVSLPKNEPSAPKTKPCSRILTEAAPWRQQERGVANSKASQCRDAEARPITTSLYADIEKRLGGLEFLECNKDFRALRILGALHAKDAKRQNNDVNTESVADQGQLEDPTTSSRNFQPPIVVMKPARTIEKPVASVASLSGLRNLRKLQPRDSSFTGKNEGSTNEKIHCRTARAQFKSDEPVSTASSPRPTGSSSPRLVQRKAESERRSRPPVSPKSPSPSTRSNEAASSRGRTRSKPSLVKNHRDNEVLQSPGSRISLAKHVDVSIMDCQKPLAVSTSLPQPSYTAATPGHKGRPSVLDSDQKIHSLENIPSPVSVLDASFYHKRISDSFKDGETHTSDDSWNPNSLPDTPQSKTSTQVNQIKPENLEALIQKLEQLQSMNEEAANSKDHQYIYEILLASGLLHKELNFAAMPGRHGPSSCPINPELFLILEQTKPHFVSATQVVTGANNISNYSTEKVHRRLLFDLVNEIIAQKMNIYISTSETAKFLRSRKLNGWRLFKDLCTEVDRLQTESSARKCSEEDEHENTMLAEDAPYEMEDWRSFDGDLQGMVLDIERSIFRDLIDEVIGGEATEKMQDGQWKLRRQLSFSSVN